MAFDHPWSLLALAALLPLLLAFRNSDARSRRTLETLQVAPGTSRIQRGRFLLVACFVACLAIVAAKPYSTPAVTGDYVLLLDTSRSMQASHSCAQPTFLDRAKAVARQILADIPEGRFSIFVFDRLAFPVTPMSYDHDYLGEVLEHAVFVGMTYQATRTNLGNALEAVASKKRDLPGLFGDVRQLILISDGMLGDEDWRSQLEQATDRLRQAEISVVALGIGNADPTPIQLTTASGDCQEEALEIDNGAILVPLVRDTLQYASAETQGRYFDEGQVHETVEYLRDAGLTKKPAADTAWHEAQRRYRAGTFLALATAALLLLLIWERRST